MKAAAAENESVESAVEDVTERAGENHGDAENRPESCFFAGQQIQVNPDGRNGQNPEDTQCQLSPFAGKLKTKSHPVVFGEVNDAPVTKKRDFLTNGHGKLDVKLQHLVEQEHEKNDQERSFHRNNL